MRVALHSVLVDGGVADYRREHARIPDELRALFGRAGIADWTIWRSGADLFHLVECDDFARAMAIVDPDPANERWQAHIGRFVRGFQGPDGEDGLLPLERVWRMTDEAGAAGEDGRPGGSGGDAG